MPLSGAVWRKRLPYLIMISVFAVAVVYVLNVLPGQASRGEMPASTPVSAPSPFSHGDGLSDSHDGFLIQPVVLPTTRGKAPISFRILGPTGKALTEYETAQTKPLHLYLIRDDVSGYQHLHPTLVADVWSTEVDLDDGGAYRVYAEFTPKGRDVLSHPTTLGLPFVIAGDTRLAPLPGPAGSVSVDGFAVTRLDGTAHLRAGKGALLRFQVSSGTGLPQLEPHLGAMAHLSAFEVRTQGLTHAHAAAQAPESTLTFHVEFANRGEQRLFLEFKVAGQVHRTAFTIFVT
jgi:hypothetical protein